MSQAIQGNVGIAQLDGNPIDVGAGPAGAGTQRVILASDSPGTGGAGGGGASAGDVAHDGVDSGNPVKVGAKATASLSGLTLVAAGDRTNLFAGVDGVQIVRPH